MEPLLQDTRGIVDFHALEFHVALDNNEGSSQMIDYLRGANITISNQREILVGPSWCEWCVRRFW
jgi:hypothetical protein